MPVLIPIVRQKDDTGFMEQQATLDGVTYTLEFRWNVRLGAWFMNVLSADGSVPYLLSVRLVADWPLEKHHTGRRPPGLFFAIDTASPNTGGGSDPGFDDLGNRVQLHYFSVTELG